MLGLISEEQENYSHAVEYYQRLEVMKPSYSYRTQKELKIYYYVCIIAPGLSIT
jgi:hypothetical protein